MRYVAELLPSIYITQKKVTVPIFDHKKTARRRVSRLLREARVLWHEQLQYMGTFLRGV
jgi:hypothetical protein